MDIKTAIASTLQHASDFRSPETARSYKNALAWFSTYLVEKRIKEDADIAVLDPRLFTEYPSWLITNHFAQKTNALYLSGVKYFLEWLFMGDYLTLSQNDATRIKKAFNAVSKKHEALMIRFPDKDDVDKMLMAVREIQYADDKEARILRLRDIAIVELLASSGCRNSEAATLKVGGIDLKERKAIVMGKGRKERYIYFAQRTITALVDYWTLRGPVKDIDPAFARHDLGARKSTRFLPITPTTIRNVVSEAKKIAGIKTFSPHWFRHAFAIKTLRETGNLALVQDFLGHLDPKATRIYAKITDQEKQDAHREIFK